ncbi:MAG: DUF805 domain-containing protein [Duncaniella sp.]|nr:DUF805 domain-containing protein [Duncaniella sp.]
MYQYQVSFSDAVRRALTVNYCNFQGRASRSEYWWFFLFSNIVGCIISPLYLYSGSSAFLNLIFGILYYAISLYFLLPSLGLLVRRLHDTGRSAWNILWFLLPVIGWIVLIVYLVQDSTPGDNEYGPVPNVTE